MKISPITKYNDPVMLYWCVAPKAIVMVDAKCSILLYSIDIDQQQLALHLIVHLARK